MTALSSLHRSDFRFRVEYTKKKEKKDTVKFIKDETVPRGDLYKSHTVHVQSGEPPNSVSRPVPKKKEGVVRPITQGKLLRKGGPGVRRFSNRLRNVFDILAESIHDHFTTETRRATIAWQIDARSGQTCCGRLSHNVCYAHSSAK